MYLIPRFISTTALILTLVSGFAGIVSAPNTESIFNPSGQSVVAPTHTGPGLWITPLTVNQRPSEGATQGFESLPQSLSNIANSANSTQLFNSLFNNSLLNQIGVGVKVNF